jgi:hypothetical protein
MTPRPGVLLRGFGTVALVIGVLSLILSFTPPNWGSVDWEVAFFAEFSATLGLPMLGIAVLAVEGLANSRRAMLAVLGVLLILIGVVAAVGVVSVGTALPLVWGVTRGFANAAQATGYKVVTVKALALCGVYAVFSIGLAGYVIRSLGSKGRVLV